MMPDLGAYAFEILMSYGISLGLLGGLIGLSIWQGRRVKAALERIEKNG
ncbi:heme exporter protein CcmD [Loktanella sp. F6476L]|nr:heme exporter protein CcmD [Loktanella sp. F6476L]MCK0120805.1 heme exporter protein CcmD [Loktanella sp. F6476L]UWQ98285.1 heme exporter protein CcmD [Rhodobacteraceae bacterium S2214]